MVHTFRWTLVMLVALLAAGPTRLDALDDLAPLAPRTRVTIAMVFDGRWQRGLEVEAIVRAEIADLVRDEFDLRFAEPRLGDWTAAGARRVMDAALRAPDVDVVIALGILVSNDAAHRARLAKPTIAPLVADPRIQDIPFRDGASGVSNLNYIVAAGDFPSELRALHDVAAYDAIAFLGFEHVLTAVPAMRDNLSAAARAVGARAIFVPVETPEATLAAVPADIDAVVVGPLFRLTPEAFTRLVAGINDRRLPSLAVVDVGEVDQGLLASLSPRGDVSRLARRVALNLQSILLGEDAGTLPVTISERHQLTLNMATARAIGVSPRWDVLSRAVLLHEEPSVEGRALSLRAAAVAAIDANLDLRVADRTVAAGRQSVRREMAALLPQVAGRLTGTTIDDDRAEASLGAQRERTLTGAVTLSQSVYSDREWAAFQIERHAQRAREEDRAAVRLDIVRDAAVAYLDVLRTKALERIEKENLDLTRENLELAQVRVKVGVSDRSDEYRWESEIASDRSAVIQAAAVRRRSEIALNRLLHRPLEERFATEEATIDDPELLVGRGGTRYVDRPATFTVYRDFMVELGLARSPDLRGLDAAIAAQKRVLVAARRAFWLPDVAVQAEYADRLAEDGAGDGGLDLSDVLDVGIPRADDQDWIVGLQATLPLFTSGARVAEMRRASEELARARTVQRATAERIEQDIRSTLLEAQASFAAIRLTRESAAAARKNLDLVTDAYSRGVVGIITLLDAQNAAFVADQAAATAVFAFLTDWMRVQRAVSEFDFLLSEAERDAVVAELDAYYVAAGVPLGR